MFSSGNNGDNNKPNLLGSNIFSNIGSGGLFGNLLNNNMVLVIIVKKMLINIIIY